jgi:hypothetical protein
MVSVSERIASSFNNLSLNESSEQTVVNKINDRNSHNVVEQEHTKSEVFDLSLEDNDVMGEYTVLDNDFDIDKSTFCTNMYDTKYCNDVYSSYITTGTNYLSDLVVNGNAIVNETCKGNLTKTGETKGDVHEKFTTMGKQTVEYVRGGDRNFSVTVEGNEVF